MENDSDILNIGYTISNSSSDIIMTYYRNPTAYVGGFEGRSPRPSK